MRTQPPVLDTPTWWQNPVSRILVLAVAGTLAACLGGATVAVAGGAPLHHQADVEHDLEQIHEDLVLYRGVTGDWPSSLSEVYAQLPTDPWGHAYVYAPPVGARLTPDVATLGADHWPGGDLASTDRWMSAQVNPWRALPRWGDS